MVRITTTKKGVQTNKTVRNAYTADYKGEIWVKDAVVPLALDKQKRWEMVDEINAEQQKPVISKKERREKNRAEKKQQFSESLKEQKQKHVVRHKTPVRKDADEQELGEEESVESVTEKSAEQDDDEGWTVVQYDNKNKDKTPMWRSSSVQKTNAVFLPPSKKTIINHMSGHETKWESYERDTLPGYKRRLMKNETREFLRTL
jgi:hypothetical protein